MATKKINDKLSFYKIAKIEAEEKNENIEATNKCFKRVRNFKITKRLTAFLTLLAYTYLTIGCTF